MSSRKSQKQQDSLFPPILPAAREGFRFPDRSLSALLRHAGLAEATAGHVHFFCWGPWSQSFAHKGEQGEQG